jgi:hypothetical protein
VPTVAPGAETPMDPSVPPGFISDVEVGELTVGLEMDEDEDDVVVEPRLVPLVPGVVPIDPVVEEPIVLEESNVPVEDNEVPLVPELMVDVALGVGRLLLVVSELVEGLLLAPRLVLVPGTIDAERELDVVSDDVLDVGTQGRENGVCAGGVAIEMGGFI